MAKSGVRTDSNLYTRVLSPFDMGMAKGSVAMNYGDRLKDLQEFAFVFRKQLKQDSLNYEDNFFVENELIPRPAQDLEGLRAKSIKVKSVHTSEFGKVEKTALERQDSEAARQEEEWRLLNVPRLKPIPITEVEEVETVPFQDGPVAVSLPDFISLPSSMDCLLLHQLDDGRTLAHAEDRVCFFRDNALLAEFAPSFGLALNYQHHNGLHIFFPLNSPVTFLRETSDPKSPIVHQAREYFRGSCCFSRLLSLQARPTTIAM